MSSSTCNSILLISCLYFVSIPLVKEMGSCDYWGSWPSGYGLISKGLGNGGPIFNSCNRKCSKNNFMLTKCSLTHFLFTKNTHTHTHTHTHKRKVVVGSISNLSVIYIYSLGVVVTNNVTQHCVLSINSHLQLWKHNVFYPYSFMFFLFLPKIIFF